MSRLDKLRLIRALFLFAAFIVWVNRIFTSSGALLRAVSRSAWVSGSRVMVLLRASHLFTVRVSTPRCAAKARTLSRMDWRSALVSAPVQRWTVAMVHGLDSVDDGRLR